MGVQPVFGLLIIMLKWILRLSKGSLASWSVNSWQ